MLFWIAFGMSVQWLVFFKRQKTVSLILPTDSQEKLFLTIFYVAFSFKLLDVLHMLVSQIFFDIFFIDWERPQGRVNQPTQRGEASAMDAPVSIWRTLFIANEWNEIQTIRKVNPELQIFLVLFFLKVAGFEYFATTDPVGSSSVNYTTEYVGDFSKVLRFAILSIVFLSLEALQWFFFAFIYERFVGDSLGDFIDLCSMSNVSIFVLEVSALNTIVHVILKSLLLRYGRFIQYLQVHVYCQHLGINISKVIINSLGKKGCLKSFEGKDTCMGK